MATNYKEKTIAWKTMAEKVTNMVIKAIEEGKVLPWVKPWKGGNSCSFLDFNARSYVTGKPYNLLNQILMDGDGEYLTLHKCHNLGGRVKKGAKCKYLYTGTMKSFPKRDKDNNIVMQDGEPVMVTVPCFKYCEVFNIDDCEMADGTPMPRKWSKKPSEEPIKKPIVAVEEIPIAEETISKYVSLSGVTFINNINSGRAYYSPSEDKVVVPNKEQFELMNEYYSTTFHELTHSTLTKERCNRPQDEEGRKACFGNAPYAKEELVAELGACLMLAKLGISTETTERNSAAYLQNWLGALKDDSSLLLSAIGKAEKATKFILNEKEEKTKEVA